MLVYHTWIRARGQAFRPRYDTSLGQPSLNPRPKRICLHAEKQTSSTLDIFLTSPRGVVIPLGSHLYDPVDDDVHWKIERGLRVGM